MSHTLHPMLKPRLQRSELAVPASNPSMIDKAAAGLSKLGVGVGKPLALLLPNTPWHPVLFFAGLKIGARIVHISPLDAERAGVGVPG